MAYSVGSIIRRVLVEGQDVVGSAIPGEAPGRMNPQPVLTEPDNGGGVDLYGLYPELSQVDPQDPCALADFFAQVCETQHQTVQAQQQTSVVPSLKNINTPNEF